MRIEQMRKAAQRYGYNIQTYFNNGWKYRIVEFSNGYDLLPLTDYHSKRYIIYMLDNLLSGDMLTFEDLNLWNMSIEDENDRMRYVYSQ